MAFNFSLLLNVTELDILNNYDIEDRNWMWFQHNLSSFIALSAAIIISFVISIEAMIIYKSYKKSGLFNINIRPNDAQIDWKQTEREQYEQHCLGDHVSKCRHLYSLNNIMRKYKEYKYDNGQHNNFMNNIKIQQVVNSFLHLKHCHNDDEQFEYIFNKLGYCDINKCKVFKRNNRNRNDILIQCNVSNRKLMNDADKDSTVSYQIMDKIHCYFQHCYDIGNKALIKYNDISFDGDSRNNQKILKSKQAKTNHRSITYGAYDRMNRKYNQLFANPDSTENKTDEMYSFGYKFKYGYPEEDANEDGDHIIPISAKYSSLKEEMINNDISTMSAKQFDNEYAKAIIYFNSDYKMSNPLWTDINLEYLLSLMIYCNYTELQYQFSMTYRVHNGDKHKQFYHLGKCLKISVQQYGVPIADGDTKSFYHGTGQRLLFPKHFGNFGCGVSINCPLSTTSSFAVATNFTNNNNGMVIEFTGVDVKYFSVSWLSDFPNESEFLFLQHNNYWHGLTIHNIYDAKLGHQYKTILKAFKIIGIIINHGYFTGITDSMYSIINCIFSNQLSYKLKQYKSLDSLTEYAKEMCTVYFNNQKWIFINYLEYKTHFSFIFDLLFHTNYEWIKLDLIHALFPNIQCIFIEDIRLCSLVLDDILNYLTDKNTESKSQQMMIKINENSDLSVQQAMDEYESIFRENSISLSMYNDAYGHYLYINIENDQTETDIELDVQHETTNIFSKLIATELSNTNKSRDNQHDHQQLFHRYCIKKKSMRIDWENINLGSFRLFYHPKSDCEWTKIEILNALYPNLTTLYIYNIRLCPATFDKILDHLRDDKKTKLTCIWMRDLKVINSDLNVSSMISGYEEQFKCIKFKIKDMKLNGINIIAQHAEC